MAFLVEVIVGRVVYGGELWSVFILRNRSIARSRRRKGRWLFSARLFNQRPVSCRSTLPISFMAAP
jgi:hypothetical protein